MSKRGKLTDLAQTLGLPDAVAVRCALEQLVTVF